VRGTSGSLPAGMEGLGMLGMTLPPELANIFATDGAGGERSDPLLEEMGK
jgi:hypothetical protein